tara:strand:+ start:44782 stop:45246 length:465 start_codon:yes stop_codon:yes gene_type:complete
MTHEISLPLVYINPVLGQVLGGDTTAAPSTQAPGAAGAPAGQTGATGSNNIFFFAMIMMVGMFLIMSMSGRKEKKKRAAMLSTLGKRDKVRSAGGIIGTIIEVKDEEVLIETDRSSHTRLWLARASISTVLDSSKSSSAASDAESNKDAESLAS